MTSTTGLGAPSPCDVLLALILWSQGTLLCWTMTGLSIWRGMWLSSLLCFSFVLTNLLASESRLVKRLYRVIPDKATLYSVLFLVFVLVLPLAVIGTLFYKHAAIRQGALFVWSVLVCMPLNMARNGDFELKTAPVVWYLLAHHAALFTAFHFGFEMGVPFKFPLALSVLWTFVRLSGSRGQPSKSVPDTRAHASPSISPVLSTDSTPKKPHARATAIVSPTRKSRTRR